MNPVVEPAGPLACFPQPMEVVFCFFSDRDRAVYDEVVRESSVPD